ncbi:pituitary adenylate cyclase-activating polypeptide isoform X1 [Opisthocomus hoazin]|uniref:pituitary adenylate cyclase-activating polypeptide isoform X1 n=2 Tax=Opisthocomus hoazin TaxID=30419 RepID=UPI003F539779
MNKNPDTTTGATNNIARPQRVAMCSKAILALLLYGIIMHCSVYCSPAAGLQYPALRLEDEAYDEDGNTLQDFAYDHEPLGIANPSSVIGEVYSLYYSPEKRHADGIFNKAYRRLLGQLSARKYLHSLMAKRVGGAGGGPGEEAEPLTKRHIDGIFTDSYSRYRKQMAVKKYLAAVLGKRVEDINFHHLLLYIEKDALLPGDYEENDLGELVKQILPPVSLKAGSFATSLSEGAASPFL